MTVKKFLTSCMLTMLAACTCHVESVHPRMVPQPVADSISSVEIRYCPAFSNLTMLQ